MGCGGSRLEGGATVLPARLRPLFFHRLEDIRLRRHTRTSQDFDSTPSKKELLLPDREDDEDTASSSHKTGFKTAPVSPVKEQNGKEVGTPKKEASHHKMKEEEEEEKFYTDFENEDDEDENDERMISHRDGGFPGSPSFRVYFNEEEIKEDEEEQGDRTGHANPFASNAGKGKDNDAFKNIISSDDNASCDETTSSKESSENNKKVKRGRKKRSFRKVFPRGGQVKNLLNVTSCYTPPTPIQDNTRLLPDRTISK